MIINIQFRCEHMIKKKREFEYEDEEDLVNPIGVICFNHAIFLAAQGFHIRAEVGDQEGECPLCHHPELYVEALPELPTDWFKDDPQWFKDLASKARVDPPPLEDVLGFDKDDLGWWKCRACGKTYHPSRFKDHMKECVPAPSGQVTT